MSSVIRRKPDVRIGAGEREGKCSGMTSPWVVATTRRRGRKPAQISPLVKTMFPLDGCADFWESLSCNGFEIPGLVPEARPATGGLFLVWGVTSFQNGLRRGTNQFARCASVFEKPAAFKRADTTACGFGAGR